MKKDNTTALYPWFLYPCNSFCSDSDSDNECSEKSSWATPIPFSPHSAILLLGEGNFSFAASLVTQLSTMGHSSLFFATCIEPKEVLYKKYPEAENNIDIITKHNGKVLFNLDATKAGHDRRVMNKPWTRIIFQFPHLGTGIKDQSHNIYHHQRFLRAVFQSVSKLFPNTNTDNSLYWNLSLRKQPCHEHSKPVNSYIIETPKERPEFHITLKTGLPYDQWEIKKLAKTEFQCLTSFPFIPSYYSSYQHVNTNASNNHNDHLNGKQCTTTVFVPKSQFIQKRKHGIIVTDI